MKVTEVRRKDNGVRNEIIRNKEQLFKKKNQLRIFNVLRKGN